MRIAQTLAFHLANLRGLTRFNPDDRVGGGNIGELELIDTDLGVFRLLRGRVVKRRHVLASANLLEPGIRVIDPQSLQLGLRFFGRNGMARDGWIALAHNARLSEYLSDGGHLGIR